MQTEASEEILSAGKETLRLGKSYSEGPSSEHCAGKWAHTHEWRQEDGGGILSD